MSMDLALSVTTLGHDTASQCQLIWILLINTAHCWFLPLLADPGNASWHQLANAGLGYCFLLAAGACTSLGLTVPGAYGTF